MTKKDRQTPSTKKLHINKEQITRKLEHYLQFRRVPRFQNHRNKILINSTDDARVHITIQRPLERLTQGEKKTLLINTDCRIELLSDGLTYERVHLVYTAEELEGVLNNI